MYVPIYFYSFLNQSIFFLAVLDLCCCMGSSLVAASRGYSPVAGREPLIAVASRVVEHRL